MNLTGFGIWTGYHTIGAENAGQAARLVQDLGATVAAKAAATERDYPDRSLIGIGVDHPEATRDYTRPRHATIRFLDALDGAPAPLSRERRVLAACGPKMLDLPRERSLGSQSGPHKPEEAELR